MTLLLVGGGTAPNSSFSTAKTIYIGNLNTTISYIDRVGSYGTSYYYKFSVTADSNVNITVSNVDDNARYLDVYFLTSATWNNIDKKSVNAPRSATFNEKYLNANQTYYLVIEDWDFQFPNGNFRVNIYRNDTNTLTHPKSITTNYDKIDYAGDDDYFQFTANESGVWGYKITGILNADISIICNDEDILYSNPAWSQYGSANYPLTNSSFFAFKEGGHYTIKVKGSNIGTYSINKYYDIGMQTIELNSKSFTTSVVYSYPGYIDGYQGYEIGYFTTKDKAKLFIESLRPSYPEYGGELVFSIYTGYAMSTTAAFALFLPTFVYDNVTVNMYIDYIKQQIDEVESESVFIAMRLENSSVNHYKVTIGPWDQKTYHYSDIYYFDYTTTTDKSY